MTLWGFEGDRCYCWNDKKKIACRIFDTLTRGKSPPFRSPASHPSPAMCPVSGGGRSPTSWKSLESSMLIHQWSSSLVAFIVILSCCRLNHSDLAGWQTFFSLPWGKKKYAPGHHLKLSLGSQLFPQLKVKRAISQIKIFIERKTGMENVSTTEIKTIPSLAITSTRIIGTTI